MYCFENEILLTYEYCTCVTDDHGQKTTFRKVEHIGVRKDNSGFLFTFNGSSDETIDGAEPVDWSEIYYKFGKILYPYTLKVSDEGKLVGVQNFDSLRNRWLRERFDLIEYYQQKIRDKDVSYSYMKSLDSERKFLSVLRRDMFFHLFFWQDNLPNQEIEIKDFPINSLISIFCIQNKKIDNDVLCYETDTVYDVGTFNLLSGECKVKIRRDLDGLPSEITLFAKVEKRYRGHYTKEITLRRL